MKLPLKKDKGVPRGSVAWTSAPPFVENSKGVLIHRPHHVTNHNSLTPRWKSHLAVHMLCGMTCTGTKKFTFLDAPPVGRILCAKCEAIAQEKGLPSADQLAGRHVHVGGVVAVTTCCSEIAPIVEASRNNATLSTEAAA